MTVASTLALIKGFGGGSGWGSGGGLVVPEFTITGPVDGATDFFYVECDMDFPDVKSAIENNSCFFAKLNYNEGFIFFTLGDIAGEYGIVFCYNSLGPLPNSGYFSGVCSAITHSWFNDSYRWMMSKNEYRIPAETNNPGLA